MTKIEQSQFSIPKKLEKLQNKLLNLRQTGKLLLQNGDVGIASAPSNIALIKYWGKNKLKFQEPDNSSLSFTLDHFRAQTNITVRGRFFPEGDAPEYVPENLFHLTDSESQKSTEVIPEKLSKFLKRILHPYANDIGLKIESENNFPTACGIASSAAGFAALCFALDNLLNLEKHFSLLERQYWLSQWSRLGSGSALRSTCLASSSKFVSWELKKNGSSEIKNISYHKEWNHLQHCVLILDSKEKEVSSSSGHLFADTSPFYKIRLSYVEENFTKFKQAIEEFDFDFITKFTEYDAFFMHSIMHTSTPQAIYLNTETSFVISEFVRFRQKTKIKAFWTLDAGPNVHILYLQKYHAQIKRFQKFISKEIGRKIKVYE